MTIELTDDEREFLLRALQGIVLSGNAAQLALALTTIKDISQKLADGQPGPD